MTPFNPRKILKPCLLAVFGLSACYSQARDAEQLKKRVFYWTMTGAESCVKMSGVSYCFLTKDIEAQNFETDSGAGFLFIAPTDDPVLIDCAKDWYEVDWDTRPYPNIHVTVGEPNFSSHDVHADGRVHKEKYWHVLDMTVGKGVEEHGATSPFPEPKQYLNYYGEKCLKLTGKDLLGREALCYGGDFNKGEPAYFWGCDRDGRVPNPSCRYDFYYRKLEYSFSTSKKCAPYMHKIRDFAIKFVAEGEDRFKNF